MTIEYYDRIIIGGGLYGLYAALQSGKSGKRVLLLEHDKDLFSRATYVNQARVHMGYHYPRSYSTAIKSAKYFDRFVNDYRDCILSDFQQIYATSANFSYTNAAQFKKFCSSAGIKCEEVPVNLFFNENTCDGAFITCEYTFDAAMIKEKMLSQISEFNNINIQCNSGVTKIHQDNNNYVILTTWGEGVHRSY